MLPNRNSFKDKLFSQIDLYTTGPSAPTPTAPTPTAPSPSTGGGGDSCVDSPLRFQLTKKDGKKVSRDCIWVANKATISRCKLTGVSFQCPSTCNTCDVCQDSSLRFKFDFKDRGKIARDCTWVANKNTNGRCKVDGMENTCRETCSNCGRN